MGSEKDNLVSSASFHSGAEVEKMKPAKRIRKPSHLLSQEKSLSEKVKKYLICFTKVRKRTKEEAFFKKFSLS